MKTTQATLLGILLLSLLVGLAQAVPSIQDPSTATVFVNGLTDTFTFAGGSSSSTGTVITIIGPDGTQATITRTSQGGASNSQTYRLDGTRISGGTELWTWSGDLSGTPADGTWTIEVSGQYRSADSDVTNSFPGPTLSIASKAVHFGVSYMAPTTFYQTWNWHQTTGTWDEPSTTSNLPLAQTTIDSPNEAPDEDPNQARFFQSPGGSTTPLVATGGSTVSCPSSVNVDGSWVRGSGQVGNTFVRFVLVQGIVGGDTDLRDNLGASFSTLSDDGAGASGSKTDTFSYNNAAGATYQFLARAGATGMEVAGQPVFIAPAQCTIPVVNTGGLTLNADQFHQEVSQAQCKDDPVAFDLETDAVFLLLTEDIDTTVYSTLTGMPVFTIDNSEMFALPDSGTSAKVFFWSRVFPPGPYLAVAVMNQVAGTDFFESVSFNVPSYDCGPTDLSPVLTSLTANHNNLTGYLDHINGHLHEIDANVNFTRGEILLAIENLNLTIIGNVTGNFTLDNATLTSIYNELIEHRENSLELTTMNDFNGLGFDGFLFLLFWIIALLFFAYQAWWFSLGFSIPGLLEVLFPAQIPEDFTVWFAFCLLGVLAEVAANRFQWGYYKNRNQTRS